MNWESLKEISQLEDIKEESKSQAIGLFKHSTRCSISATALDRLERNWAKADKKDGIKFYYLDLIAHRDISNKIAADFGVEHESPQFLLIKDGEVSYHESHYGINLDEILEKV